MQSTKDKPKRLFYIIMWAIAITPVLLIVSYAVLKTDVFSIKPRIIQFTLKNLPQSYKKEVYAILARHAPGISASIPEPSVGRILKKDIRKIARHAEIITNNAGMRSSRPYVAKEKDKYRIICLGDSVVHGDGAKEEDRLGDQIEEILTRLGITVNGKEIEVYSIGVPAWTALNEATYLSSRFSEYDPDLVLVLMVKGDIEDTKGVLADGSLTYGFSPEYRQYGSGVFSSQWHRIYYGVKDTYFSQNLLEDYLGPESKARWEKTFAAWKRLEMLLDKHDARMVLGVMDQVPLFSELCKYFHEQSGMKSPLIFTLFWDPLPHDNHPSRKGHQTIAAHYLHTLADLEWLPVKADDLPPLDPRLTTETNHPPGAEKILALKEARIERLLSEKIIFNQLRGADVKAFLGGIYPGKIEEPLTHYPYGTFRSGFLLRRKQGAQKVLLDIEVPPYVELYPFKLEMRLNGHATAVLSLDNEQDAGRHVLQGAIPETDEFESTVEVMLFTESYWTMIEDPTMKSYRLISAWQE